MNKDTWMPIAFPPYHVTMVVDDVKAAMADMTRLFGLQWAPLQGDGLFTYSLQGPPYLELLKRTSCPDVSFAPATACGWNWSKSERQDRGCYAC